MKVYEICIVICYLPTQSQKRRRYGVYSIYTNYKIL